MFRNLTIALVAFYLATVMLMLVAMYYTVAIAGYDNFIVIFVVAAAIATIAGLAISRIALEPLKQHFQQLEDFSKETLHELNLPINTITANLKLLKRSHGDTKSQTRLERIEMACEMLRGRYGELDYMIKKQMQREHVETFDVSELVNERLILLRSLYAHAQIDSSLTRCMVRADRIGLGKVIDNLVDNAVKYSSSPIKVVVGLEAGMLSVTDYGCGMDEVEILGIFDRYYQNDAAMPGFGIGLGLVKNYCDRYGMRLGVESRKGEGTTMRVEFKGV